MKIFLLTHEREVDRKSNTGSIAINSSEGIVERIIWDRVNPNKKLLELLESNTSTLLHPSREAKPLSSLTIAHFDHIIIIDATWQEARKIYNQSPYLKATNKATFNTNNTSQYNLRRNQPAGGLCTIECVIELLKLKGKNQLAMTLTKIFDSFNNPIKAQKSVKKTL